MAEIPTHNIPMFVNTYAKNYTPNKDGHWTTLDNITNQYWYTAYCNCDLNYASGVNLPQVKTTQFLKLTVI